MMSKKKKTNCGDCRFQLTGFDGGLLAADAWQG